MDATNARPASLTRSIRLPLLLGLGLVLITGWVYSSILWRLSLQWSHDPNFSHGFLVPLFSLFVLYQDRSRWQSLCPRPSWWGLAVLVLGLGVLVIGVLGSELFLSRSSLLLILAGLVILLLGWPFMRAVLFPWALLLLMIPIPNLIFNQITFPLQLLASNIASAVLPLLGVPVLREGNLIVLPAMALEVAEACSGIRSLLSLVTLAVIYGYFMETRAYVRVLLALCAIPIAVAANSFRIVGTGLLVQNWDPERALGFFHTFSGWVIFMASLVMLLAVHRMFQFFDPGRRIPS